MRSGGNSSYKWPGAVKTLQDLQKRPESLKTSISKIQKIQKTKFLDSRCFQVAVYAVFHEESESAVRIDQFLHPEEKIKKNQAMRVSISYRKISYYMSPP